MNTNNSLASILFGTDASDRSLLLQRLVLGAVMFPHGAQKLLGWFGGYGFAGTMTFFTDTMHLPWFVAFLVVVGELLVALMLASGLGTRVAAAGLAVIMVGAVLTTHLQHGFFMNWFGAQTGEGFEFHLLALALAAPLLVRGGGRLSVDAWLARPAICPPTRELEVA